MPSSTIPFAIPTKPPKSANASPPDNLRPPPPSSLPPPPGRNGCLSPPGTTPPPPVRPPLGAPAKSHQTGTIENHWNDLPSNFLPTSRAGSRAVSRSTSPLPPNPDNGEADTQVVAEHFEALVQRLFAAETQSSLPEREKKAMLERVLKAKVTEVQKRELAEIIEAVLEGREKPDWGREQVVGFITRNPGVAGWAMGVRRGVEGVKR